MNKNTCLSCSSKPLKNGVYKVAMHDFIRKKLPKNIKLFEDRKKSKITVEGLRPNTIIFYFATKERDFRKPILKQQNAYSTLKNSGMTKSNSNGKATFYLDCPQIYLNDNGNYYNRHFHYVLYDEFNKQWMNDLFTQPILCNISKLDLKTYMDDKNVIVFDTRKYEEYMKNGKDNMISLPYNLELKKNDIGIKDNILKPIVLYGKKMEVEIIHQKFNKLGIFNTYGHFF